MGNIVSYQNNSKAHHSILHSNDTEIQTAGCRCTYPDYCRSNRIPAVCAFVKTDGICLTPPSSWKKLYIKLMKVEDIIEHTPN